MKSCGFVCSATITTFFNVLEFVVLVGYQCLFHNPNTLYALSINIRSLKVLKQLFTGIRVWNWICNYSIFSLAMSNSEVCVTDTTQKRHSQVLLTLQKTFA